jgi:hypothetical protein
MVSVNSYGRRGVGSDCFAAHGGSSHSNVSSAVSEPQPPSIIGHKGPQQVLVSNSSPISTELVSPEGRALASFNSQLTDKQHEPQPNFGISIPIIEVSFPKMWSRNTHFQIKSLLSIRAREKIRKIPTQFDPHRQAN